MFFGDLRRMPQLPTGVLAFYGGLRCELSAQGDHAPAAVASVGLVKEWNAKELSVSVYMYTIPVSLM